MIALGAAISLQRHYVQFAEKCAGRMEIARALQTGFKGAPIASYYGASTPAHALWFGNLWAGNRYTKPLAKILESDAPAYWIHGPSGEVFFMGQQVAISKTFAAINPRSSSQAGSDRPHAYSPCCLRTPGLRSYSNDRMKSSRR